MAMTLQARAPQGAEFTGTLFYPSEQAFRPGDGMADDGWVVVSVSRPTACDRGHLDRLFDESIEAALASMDAGPAGAGESDLDGALSDKLFRLRERGHSGLWLRVPSLKPLTNLAGALGAEDSAVLRWWLDTARDRPVRLALDEGDRFLAVYGPPRPLASLLGMADPAASDRHEARARDEAAFDDNGAQAPEASRVGELLRGSRSGVGGGGPSGAEPRQREPRPCDSRDPVESQVRVRAELATPLFEHAEKLWPAWARELESATGPRPLATIEKLFAEAYLPLREAVEAGIAQGRARPILEQWAHSFEQSYSDAFDALRVRGKRPEMVLDLPDLALRVARLHGARSVQLILVDGMRFDLGMRVNRQLDKLIGGAATLTDRMLLWSALPSTTSVQLELLGRGPAGLSERADGLSEEVMVARGRAARMLRRIKAGPREVMKLDLVEARLAESGGPSLARLEELATDVAEPLANHLLHLPSRTLAVVFGDHGFVLDAREGRSSAAHHGGASPDEVLVPAFAWLVGAVH